MGYCSAVREHDILTHRAAWSTAAKLPFTDSVHVTHVAQLKLTPIPQQLSHSSPAPLHLYECNSSNCPVGPDAQEPVTPGCVLPADKLALKLPKEGGDRGDRAAWEAGA